MGDYPEGVTERDFYERDEYDEYVAECAADGDIPMPQWMWEEAQ
jgi:hypothetical protein